MVFKRRIRRLKRTFRKRPRAFFKRVRKIAKRTIYGMAETKYAITNETTTQAYFNDAPGVITFALDNIAPGSGTANRIGAQIKIMSISLHMAIAFDSNAGVDDSHCLVLVVFPRKSQSGNQPALAQIGGTTGWLDPNLWITMKRWHLSFGDHTSAQYGAGCPSLRTISWSKKFPMVCHYTAAGFIDREPYIYVKPNTLTTATPRWTFQYTTRVSFKDV